MEQGLKTTVVITAVSFEMVGWFQNGFLFNRDCKEPQITRTWLAVHRLFNSKCNHFSGRYCLKDRWPFHTIMIHQFKWIVGVGTGSGIQNQGEWLQTDFNDFFFKYVKWNETKVGVATSWFHDKCSLRLHFCTIPISMKNTRTICISFTVTDCLSFTLD